MTKPRPAERKTTAEVKAAIKGIDAAIAAAEPNAPQFNGADWRSFMALKQERHELHLLLIARRVECCKRVVSLERWLHGFDAAAAIPEAADITRAAG
jgi:hypothetical protein